MIRFRNLVEKVLNDTSDKKRAEDIAVKIVLENIVGKNWKPEDFDLSEIFDYFCPRFDFAMGAQDILEAVGTSAFANLTNVVVGQATILEYQATPQIWKDLCEIVPSDKEEERVPGFSEMEHLKRVGEKMDYPESGISDKYVTISNFKYGRIFSLTKEAVRNTQASATLLQRARNWGKTAAMDQERFVVEKVQDLVVTLSGEKVNTTYKPSGVAEALYNASGRTVNGTASKNINKMTNAWSLTNLGTAKNYIGNMIDDHGEPILISQRLILAPDELEQTIEQDMKSPEDPDTANRSVNPWFNKYERRYSPYITDEDSWYYGDFKSQFVYQQVEPVTVSQRSAGDQTEAGWNRDIIYQWKIMFYAGLGARDYRYVIGSVPS